MWAPKVAEETWKAKPVNDILVTVLVTPFLCLRWGPSCGASGLRPNKLTKYIGTVQPLNARCYKQCFAVCMCCISLRLWKAVHVASGCQAMERKFNVTAMLVCWQCTKNQFQKQSQSYTVLDRCQKDLFIFF